MTDKTQILNELVDMSRKLGLPEHDHVILGEGNTSAKIDDTAFWIKGSGEQLHEIHESGFVEVSLEKSLALLEKKDLAGESLKNTLVSTMINTESTGRPSIEILMHAVVIKHAQAKFVAHTHTTVINGMMCSEKAEEFAHARLFPDHVVQCGPDSVYIPYQPPGLPLGNAVLDGIIAYQKRYSENPKTIFLKNHGVIIFGQSVHEVLTILAMTTKAARIFHAAASIGRVHALDENEVQVLSGREDELYRRKKLIKA